MTSQELATQASYQIDAMAYALQKTAQSHDIESVESLPFLVQSLAIRIIALNGVLMAHVRGDDDTEGCSRKVVMGTILEVTA